MQRMYFLIFASCEPLSRSSSSWVIDQVIDQNFILTQLWSTVALIRKRLA